MASKLPSKANAGADKLEDEGHKPELEPSLDIPEPLYRPGTRSWGQFIQSAVLLLSCLASLGVAAIGFSFLVYIFFSRSYAPPAAHLVKDLYFDYSDSSAVAAASFLDINAFKGEQGRSIRAVTTGQKVNVWLELEAAEPYGNVNTDVFQVLAQLLTSDGRIAATASRPCLLTSWSPLVQSVRSFFTAPLVLAGLWREHQRLQVLLFSRYPDQADKPFAEFRTVLRAASTGGHLPHLYSAKVHVDLVLGIFGRIIYWMRPGTWTMLALAAASLSALGGGLLVAAAIFLIWLYSGSKAHAPVHSPPQSDVDEDEESDSELVASKLDDLKTGDGGRNRQTKPFQKSLGSPASKGGNSQSSLDTLLEDSTQEKPHAVRRTPHKQPVLL